MSKIKIKIVKISLFLFFIFTSIFLFVFYQLPDVNNLKTCITTQQNKVYLCPKSENYVTLDEVSPWLIKALVYTEDSSFYQHSGLDYYELWQSFKTNISKMKYKRGASTITQQLAKNVYFSKNKTLSRKIFEIFTALKIEETYTKKFILGKYINVVEFGNRLFGIKSASQFYFEKDPIDLTLLESVFLIHLLPNPKVYQKVYFNRQHTDFSQKRMSNILATLYRFKLLTNEDYQSTKSEVSYFFEM